MGWTREEPKMPMSLHTVLLSSWGTLCHKIVPVGDSSAVVRTLALALGVTAAVVRTLALALGVNAA